MRELNTYDVIPNGGDPGRTGGGTYTNPRGDGNRDPTIQVGGFMLTCFSKPRKPSLLHDKNSAVMCFSELHPPA